MCSYYFKWLQMCIWEQKRNNPAFFFLCFSWLFSWIEVRHRLSCSEAGTKANFLPACHLLCQSTFEDWTCHSRLKPACCPCSMTTATPTKPHSAMLGLTLWRNLKRCFVETNTDTVYARDNAQRAISNCKTDAANYIRKVLFNSSNFSMQLHFFF